VNIRLSPPITLDIDHLQACYLSGELSPRELCSRLDFYQESLSDRNIWIHYLTPEEREPYLNALENQSPDTMPLYGVPFAIKDNIHLKGIPTTAANHHLSIIPDISAFVVEQLLLAGAIPMGKTNLDQFATGLNGTRSDFGACGNSFDADYIAGGSSSGSAVAVALGLVSFALGTDTAGSGRVPAALNNIIGLKPTLGRLSVTGVIPACQTLDCVSVFARTAAQANRILLLSERHNPVDAWQRDRKSARYLIGEQFSFGVPRRNQLCLEKSAGAEVCFDAVVSQLENIGGRAVEIDLSPFLEAATLLYQGPWVNERTLSVAEFISKPELINVSVRSVLEKANQFSAADLFFAQYKLKALKRRTDDVLATVDTILTPTCPGIFTISEMEANPLTLNTLLGTFTNFMNLLDYTAVAVPAGFTDNKMPWGVTLFGPAWSDSVLACLADRLHRLMTNTIGATTNTLPDEPAPTVPDTLCVAVCGAHLEGYPLNEQLISRGGILIKRTQTAPCYRLYALAGGPPFRPGLVRSNENGVAIDVEVWQLPVDQFGTFVEGISHPLGIGQLELEDQTWCTGFICEPIGILDAKDISDIGGWRQYMAAQESMEGSQ
jgi:allophanate hydrolase